MFTVAEGVFTVWEHVVTFRGGLFTVEDGVDIGVFTVEVNVDVFTLEVDAICIHS